MKNIKLGVVDFWSSFNTNFFIEILKLVNINAIIDNNNPDLLIYSNFGYTHQLFSCKKIYFTGENLRPKTNIPSISFDFSDNEKHLRFPLYTLYKWDLSTEGGKNCSIPISENKLLEPKNLSKEELLNSKSKFCAFLVGNTEPIHRNNFFIELNKRKRVDSAGSGFNNIGYVAPEKISFIKDYKFTIAFENTSYPGYVTEKIFEPMLVDSIPIYWGNELVGKDFNEKSFINVNGMTINDAVDLVMKIDNDDDLYYEIYKQPYLNNNELTEWLDYNTLANFIKKIINE